MIKKSKNTSSKSSLKLRSSKKSPIRRRKSSSRKSTIRKSYKKYSIRRRKSTRSSRKSPIRRRSSKKYSIRRRKSTRKSPIRRRSSNKNKSLYKFGDDDKVCIPHMKEMSDKDLEYIVQALLKFNEERKEIAKSNLSKNVALSFGRRRGEYTRRNMRQLYDLSMNAARVTGTYAGYALDRTRAVANRVLNTSRMLYNSLRTQVLNVDYQTLVFSMIDLGYRYPGYPVHHRLTFLINAAMYGFVFFQDWQYILLTPLYGNMLMNIINNNDEQSLFELFILLNTIAINGGASPSEILLRIPDMGIQICNQIRYNAINSLLLRQTVDTLVRKGQSQVNNMLITEIRRMSRS
jgi:hypothetical protein